MIAVLDVGGSSIKAGLVDGRDPAGVVTRTALHHSAPADELLDRFVTAARSLDGTDRLAIAVPEPFDYAGGVSRMTHKFESLHGVALADELNRRLAHHPVVRCCNDAAAAVVGEAVAGSGTGHRRVLGVTLGTGLGAALVVDGRPIAEERGVVVGDLYRSELADGRIADDAVSARGYVADVVRGGRSPDDFGAALAEVVRPVLVAVAADVLVVGGGGLASFDAFAPSLRAGLPVPVEPARLGRFAPIVGGAEICFG